ncbi:MAG: PLP-dependent aminotransferase family protein [Gammaproteobacteria bacterium]
MLDVDGLEPGHQPLHVRIESRIRRAILDGNLPTGSRLPASRVLSHDLKVSRHTVETAFGQLEHEGFLIRRRGSGTFVADALPERERSPLGIASGKGGNGPTPQAAGPAALSRRGATLSRLWLPRFRPQSGVPGAAFTPSMPSLDWFPRSTWERLMSRAIRRPGLEHWEYGACAGLPALREAIAAHVGATRAVTCSADQVLVLTSGHQAVDLVARVLLDEGDLAWIEDPCYPTTALLLRAAGARVAGIPVDASGFDVALAERTHPGARLVYVTPSHQYPSGGSMSLQRRLALLEWARRADAWILEDDYDGDLRYAGRPLAALQALDRAGRVIYTGTFCKVMFPSLRLAFLVAPPSLVDAVVAAKYALDAHTAKHAQAALADFIQEGYLASHLRRSISEYDERRHALLGELASLSDDLEVGPADAGLHLAAYLRRPLDACEIAAACATSGVRALPLAPYYIGPSREGFALGWGCAHPARTPVAARVLARAIQAAVSKAAGSAAS